MRPPRLLYGLYERRLARHLDRSATPRHVGVILDGNRRWARALGNPASHGHRKGADKITDVLRWSEDAGVQVVTLWMLSTDNLRRDAGEVSELLEIIATAVDSLADSGRWRLRVVGALELLPEELAQRLARAVERTAHVTGMNVNVAVGYGGRYEITAAVRELLRYGRWVAVSNVVTPVFFYFDRLVEESGLEVEVARYQDQSRECLPCCEPLERIV